MSVVGALDGPGRSVSGWLRKGTASIGEQGVNSLSAFVLQIVLLRLLGLEQYGAFSIAFSALMLAAASFGALAIDPFPIIGGRLRQENLRRYIAQVARYTVAASLLFAMAAGTVLFAADALGLTFSTPLWGAVIALPFVLLFWTLRRGCYLLGQPDYGIAAAIIGAIVTFTLVWIVARQGTLSTLSAFLIVACAATMSAALLIRTLKIPLRGSTAMPARDLVSQHWHYGQWILGAAIAFWFMTGSLPLLASLFGGLEAAGAARAYFNLVVPLIQIVAALTAYTTPIVSRRYSEDGIPALRRYGLAMTAVFAAIAMAYCCALWISGPWLVTSLYDGSALGFLAILPAFILIGFAHCLYQGAGVILTATGRTDRICIAQTIAAVITILGAICSGNFYGLTGVVWAFAAGYVSLAVLLIGLAARTACAQYTPHPANEISEKGDRSCAA